ncbi:hypothetical protein [Bradyrhizobium sp. Bra78]|uniref:hypothetical protein n=1 Tax=Bradyrhizobium sp. Bra78 TaxID=2926010 RepID=UPI0021C915B6|nr:hypothetical protein [Bradyrhizobium sp. Bra78]
MLDQFGEIVRVNGHRNQNGSSFDGCKWRSRYFELSEILGDAKKGCQSKGQLIAAFPAVVERVLPELFLETITGHLGVLVGVPLAALVNITRRLWR